jgi:hypothetical protein
MPRHIVLALAAVLAAGTLGGRAVIAVDRQGGAPPMPPIVNEELYRAVAIVTGTREETRGLGFAQAFGDVLVKLTGDPAIVDDRRFAAAAAKAGDYVERFSYRDRKEGMPYIDAQGTYDRPHDLTVIFDRDRIDALVRKLGREPWRGERPRIVLFVGVENIKFANGKGTPASYMLASDGTADRSADMREALAAAAVKAGMPVALPKLAQLESRGWTAKTLGDASLSGLAAVARQNGGEVALAGRMVFSEKALGWVVNWRLERNGKPYGWSVRGVNFDAAFRNALFGAAQVLSGHGAPKKAGRG